MATHTNSTSPLPPLTPPTALSNTTPSTTSFTPSPTHTVETNNTLSLVRTPVPISPNVLPQPLVTTSELNTKNENETHNVQITSIRIKAPKQDLSGFEIPLELMTTAAIEQRSLESMSTMAVETAKIQFQQTEPPKSTHILDSTLRSYCITFDGQKGRVTKKQPTQTSNNNTLLTHTEQDDQRITTATVSQISSLDIEATSTAMHTASSFKPTQQVTSDTRAQINPLELAVTPAVVKTEHSPQMTSPTFGFTLDHNEHSGTKFTPNTGGILQTSQPQSNMTLTKFMGGCHNSMVPLTLCGIPILNVEVTANGTSTKALIDSGADITAISETFAKQVGLITYPSTIAASGANGNLLRTCGLAVMTITFPPHKEKFTVTTIVIQHLTEDVILGRNFFCESKALLDFESLTLQVTSKTGTSYSVNIPQRILPVHPTFSLQGLRVAQLHINTATTIWAITDIQATKINNRLDTLQITCPRMRNLILEYADVFCPPQLGHMKDASYHIDLEQHARPVKARDKRWALEMLPRLKTAIDSMLKAGFIRASKSQWASRIVPVNKPDGSLRVCVDYRDVNKVSKGDAYPSPNPDDIIDSLAGRQYFSKLDAEKGYYQILLDPESKEITAFTCPLGLYEFNVLPFGLKGAVACFQRIMNEALGEARNVYAHVLIDDILISSFNYEAHLEHLRDILEKMRKKHVTLTIDKCEFARERLIFLGHVIDREGVHVDPKKTEAIKNWERPTTKKQVQSFNGAVNYLRRFIPNCSHHMAPLAQLTSDEIPTKDITKYWVEAHTIAFEHLKAALTTSPVLVYPDFKQQFILETDASNTAIGAVLGQLRSETPQNKQTMKPIAYFSRKLNSAQQSYDAPTREALGIVCALEHFKHYFNNDIAIMIITDHWAHQTLRTRTDAHFRLDRWRQRLEQFNYTVVYRKGKDHVLPDALSRLASGQDELTHDYDDIPCTVGNIHIHISNIVSTEQSDDRISEWAKAQRQDPRLTDIINILENPQVTPTTRHIKWLCKHADEFQLRDSVLWKITLERMGTVVLTTIALAVPRTKVKEVLESLHNNLPDGAHLGLKLLYPILRQHFWWTNMFSDLEAHIKECVTCQRFHQGKRANPQLQSHFQPKERMEAVAIDAMSLPISSDMFNHVLVAIDIYTGFAWTMPVTNLKGVTIFSNLKEMIFSKFGYPRVLISDGGPEFNNINIVELCELANTRHHVIAPYNPQANAHPERFNRALLSLLRTALGQNSVSTAEWPQLVHDVVDVYNRASAVGSPYSRFYLMFGRQPSPVRYDWLGFLKPIIEEDIENQHALQQQAAVENFEILESRRKASRSKANESRDPPTIFPIGRLVWIADNLVQNNTSRETTKKLAPKWIGPGVVTAHVSTLVTERIRMLGGSAEKPINHKQLKLYVAPKGEPDCLLPRKIQREQVQQEPLRRSIRGVYKPQSKQTEEKFVVDKIVTHRWTNYALEFEVHWEGYEELTWEPELNLECPMLVQAYFETAMRPLPEDDLSRARRT